VSGSGDEPDDELRAVFSSEAIRHLTLYAAPTADLAQRAGALHGLRGAAAMMHYDDAVAIAVEMENRVRARDPTGADASLPALCQSLRRERIDLGDFDAGAVVARRTLALADARRSERPAAVPPSMPPGAIEPDVLAFFHQEARGRVDRLRAVIDELSRTGEMDALDEAFRHVHAIKGAASVVGLGSVARSAHAIESALAAMRTRTRAPSGDDVDAIEHARLLLHAALTDAAVAPAANLQITALLRNAGLVRDRDFGTKRQAEPADDSKPSVADIVRVPVAAIGSLSETTGEMGFLHDRIDAHADGVRALSRTMADSARAVAHALRRIGPARPWGAPADALATLGTVQRALGRTHEDLELRAERLSRDAGMLQSLAGNARESLAGLGATTARWLFDRVAAVAEDLARRQGKDIVVLRQGEDTVIERTVAERLVEPFAQLARNAVVHGFEEPAVRMSHEKPARATLRLTAAAYGDWRSFVIEDDGVGIDAASVRTSAGVAGVPIDADDDAGALAALFLPGVSTRLVADTAAGRGVGLDLVQREVSELGGTIEVTTCVGAFTRFDVQLRVRPLVQRVLVVFAAGASVAIPIDRVIRVVQSREDAIGARLVTLATAIGARPSRPPSIVPHVANAAGPIVLLDCVGGPLGVQVDDVGRPREFVVRPLPALVAGLKPWAATTLDGEGRVLLVLDVDQVAEAGG